MSAEFLAVVALTVVRIGVPLMVIFALSYLVYRWVGEEKPTRASVQAAAHVTVAGPAPIARVLAGPHCWNEKGCTEEAKAKCPAVARPELPCWLAIQMKTGHLKQNCPDCNFYERPILRA